MATIHVAVSIGEDVVGETRGTSRDPGRSQGGRTGSRRNDFPGVGTMLIEVSCRVARGRSVSISPALVVSLVPSAIVTASVSPVPRQSPPAAPVRAAGAQGKRKPPGTVAEAESPPVPSISSNCGSPSSVTSIVASRRITVVWGMLASSTASRAISVPATQVSRGPRSASWPGISGPTPATKASWTGQRAPGCEAL